jgi:hypothetical protein
MGYYIVGRCQDYDIIITNAPDSVIQKDQTVIDNCLTVLQAAKAFAADNGGAFPGNLADVTPTGKTFLDYLPDGRRLKNPYYYNLPTEPIPGLAAWPGGTGYLALDTVGSGKYNGCYIEGMGPWYYELIFKQAYHVP